MGRTIVDHRTATAGHLVGVAWLAPDDGGLGHEEEGTLCFGAHQGRARRRLLYRSVLGAAAEVAFADGRPFHHLDLATGHWEAEHLCRHDLYRGTFTVSGDGGWEVTWLVRGPAKDLRLSTTYRRAGR